MKPKLFCNRLTADTILQAVLRLYLFFLCAVFPLYIGRGRYDLMIYYKKDLLIRGTAAAVIAVIVLLGVKWILERPKPEWKKLFSRYDFLIGGFFLITGISFLHSIDRYDGWNGAPGWFMGMKTMLILLAVYIFYAKLMRWHRLDALLVFSGPFIVMGLAVLNRFGIALINPSQYDPMYLSTIGNTNWLSCYTAVVFSAGAGLYVSGVFKEKAAGILWSLFLTAGYVSILTNGSDSVFLWLAALLAVLLCWGSSSKEAMIRVIHCLVLLGLSLSMLAVIQKLRPDIRADYMFPNATGLAAKITRKFYWIPVTAILAGAGVYIRKSEIPDRNAEYPLRMLIVAGAAVTAVVLLVQLTGIITIPDEFGTGRGYLWRLTADLFRNLPADRKLLGVGPDCYGRYTLRDWDFMMALMEMFPGSSAANAHSEPLTMLVNLGFLGTGAYFAAVIYGCLETAKLPSPYRLPVLAAVVSCTACQLVSFQLIVSTPYLFLALAFAGYLILHVQPETAVSAEPVKTGPKRKKKRKKKKR